MRIKKFAKYSLVLIVLIIVYFLVEPHWEFYKLRRALEKEETLLEIIDEIQAAVNYEKFQYLVFDSEDPIIPTEERSDNEKENSLILTPIIHSDNFKDNLKKQLNVNRNQRLRAYLYLKNDQFSCIRILLRNNAWVVVIVNTELGSECSVREPVLFEIDHGIYSVKVSRFESRFRD